MTEEQTVDLAAEMDSVWQKFEAEQQPVEAPVEPREPSAPDLAEEAPAEAPVEAGPERDEHGRFKAKDAPEGENVEAEAPAEEPEKTEEAPAPKSLPREIREAWAKLDPEAREAFKRHNDELTGKLSRMGREHQGIKPIFDKVVEAANVMPQLRDMTPAQIADEVFELAQWAARLNDNPADAIMEIAEMRGVREALAARLGGQQPGQTANYEQKIAHLEKNLQMALDPARIEEIVSQRLEERETIGSIQDFARSREDWAEVEPYLPHFVPVARQILESQGAATPASILDKAYTMAVNEIPSLQHLRRTAPAMQQTRESATAARSVNVKPSGAGKPAPISLRQEQEEIWRKHYGG